MSARRRYYRVGSSFWHDHPWTDDQRLAALYLLTCEHRNGEGLFRLPFSYAATDLGWTERRFAKAFAQLERDEFVEYDPNASVCFLVNALKWQKPDNGNQAKAAVKGLRNLPRTPLLNRLLTVSQTLCPTLATELCEGFPELTPQPAPEPALKAA